MREENVKIVYSRDFCPICESPMKKYQPYIEMAKFTCKNGCYEIIAPWKGLRSDVDTLVFFFKSNFTLRPIRDTQHKIDEKLQEIVDTINYWRKDNRYIVEILTSER